MVNISNKLALSLRHFIFILLLLEFLFRNLELSNFEFNTFLIKNYSNFEMLNIMSIVMLLYVAHLPPWEPRAFQVTKSRL